MNRIANGHIGMLVASIFCIGLSFAAHSSATVRSACSSDIERFCKNVTPGGGAVANCLKQYVNELSAPCKEHVVKVQQRREKMKEFNQACKEDKTRFCNDIIPGRGGIARCLKEHENELSAPCGEKIRGLREIK